jgi:hypothetical protein
VPTISRFYGIVIGMFFDEHAPPHFHVKYAEYEASIDIRNFSVLRGKLPPKALSLVVEWAALHQKELMADWVLAAKHDDLKPIEPLR